MSVYQEIDEVLPELHLPESRVLIVITGLL
jgi:hypothetical protein